jgi:hypothetical protein
MAIGKDNMLEKHDCYTNNASSNKGGIKKYFGSNSAYQNNNVFSKWKVMHKFLFNFSLHPTLKGK